jgi:hypothetical protein
MPSAGGLPGARPGTASIVNIDAHPCGSRRTLSLCRAGPDVNRNHNDRGDPCAVQRIGLIGSSTTAPRAGPDAGAALDPAELVRIMINHM